MFHVFAACHAAGVKEQSQKPHVQDRHEGHPSSGGRMTSLIFLYGASDSILFAPSKTLIGDEFH
jgi:hypothetical protein